MLDRLFFGALHPEIYHGRPDAQHFEGWYFKLVDATHSTCWAIIPGIYKSSHPEQSCAFIMTLDGSTHQSVFHKFHVDEFEVRSEQRFDISIGTTNHFSCQQVTLDLPELRGTLRFGAMTPWPVSWHTPGVMGVFAYLPMECYHGLLSMDHTVNGTLQTKETTLNFNGGRGYLEKDWGTNFPKCWIWIQANHFLDCPGTSVSVSIARVPCYGWAFPGFIIGVRFQGQLYQFTTYVGAKLKTVQVDEDAVTVRVHNTQHYSLCVRATRARTAVLHMPTRDEGMIPKVDESVGSVVAVQLYQNDQRVFEGMSRHGGLEVFGEYEILLH